MNYLFKGAFIALALAGAPIAASVPVSAAVDFSVSLGNAAFGYTDGYWDRDHVWHNWQNKDEAQYYQTHNSEHYIAKAHDSDPKDQNKGWNNDRYWDKH